MQCGGASQGSGKPSTSGRGLKHPPPAALPAADDPLGVERNPEYHRVRRQIAENVAKGIHSPAATAEAESAPQSPSEAASAQACGGWPPVPEGELFDVILATEVLYEMHAAVTLPVRGSGRSVKEAPTYLAASPSRLLPPLPLSAGGFCHSVPGR